MTYFSPSPKTSIGIDDFLQQSRHYALSYGNGLSTHLPMALIALKRLGADDTRLSEFYGQAIKKLAPLIETPLPQIRKNEWQRDFGKQERFTAYCDFFSDQILSVGRDQVLSDYLPDLMPGISAAAFHGLIRLAYGIDFEDNAEIAAGLAWIACQYFELGERVPTEGIIQRSNPASLLHDLNAPEFARWNSESDLILKKIEAVVSLPAFAPVVHWLRIDELETLGSLARCAVRLYANTGNFTALHMLTSCHAFRVLLPYLANRKSALAWYWQAYAAAYISTRETYNEENEISYAETPVDWNDIATLAISSDNDHIVKVVYSCREEYIAYGNPHYWVAARYATRHIKNRAPGR